MRTSNYLIAAPKSMVGLTLLLLKLLLKENKISPYLINKYVIRDNTDSGILIFIKIFEPVPKNSG